MDAINKGKGNYAKTYKKFGLKYPSSYGPSFSEWIFSDSLKPYNSFGNGSGMRVSPVGWAYNTIEDVLSEAKKSAECTHSHPEGIKGALAIAEAYYKEIPEHITSKVIEILDKGLLKIVEKFSRRHL
jgi:ADP-ribosylglycohydrolase